MTRAEPDGWTWTAYYEDGSTLKERDDHGIADIDLARIRAFGLDHCSESNPRFRVLIDPAKHQRPIFFRRKASPWLIAGGEVETLATCIGREETVNGTTVSTYVFIDAEGHVLIVDNDHPLDDR